MSELASDHLRNAAREFPAKVAIAQEGRELTWSEFDQAVERVARRLVTAGLAPTQSVLILSGNSPEFLILCFGVWRAGGVMAVVHASTEPEQLDYALANAEPRFLFAEEEYRAAAAATLKRTGTRAQIFDLAIGHEPLDGVAPFTGELAEVDPAAVGVVGYTSGTTGMPKPVAHSHLTIGRGTDACARIWDVSADDTVLVSMPLSWLAGLIILSVTATTRGAKIHLLRQFSAERALDAMLHHGTSVFFAATSTYAKIVSAWRHRNVPATFRLRCCISGGEARNESVFREWRKITGAEVFDSYGASECWPFVTHDFALDRLPPPGAAGKLVAGATIRLLGPDGKEVAPGDVGEAQARALCMMICYWKEPGLTAAAMTPDGWYRTGDTARIDSDGYVYILGRTTDVIVSGGGKLYPAEVEQVLSEIDYVVQVAVVGIPSSNGGQSVAAAVVAAPGATADPAAMRAHCASQLTAFKVPSVIRVVSELPHNASGKVVRRDVAQMLVKAPDPVVA